MAFLKAMNVELFSDIWACLEVLYVLVGMFPGASRRISLSIDLSRTVSFR